VTPDLLQLLRDPARAADLPPEAIPPLLTELAARQNQLAALQITLVAQLMAATNGQPAPPAEGDRLLTAEEVAPILGLAPEQVGRRKFPFRRKLGHRTVKYSAAGLRKWLAVKRA